MRSPKPFLLIIATFLISADMVTSLPMQTNNIISFFQKNLFRLLSALVFLATLLFLLDRFFLKKESAFTRDYITASEIFEKILAAKTPSSDSLDLGVALLKKHPSLNAEKQGVLALALLQNQNIASSLALSQAHLERVTPIVPPLYLEFAKTTLALHDNNYSLGLEQALLLEEKLKNAPLFSKLRGANLVRIAFLSRKLNQNELASQTLTKLKTENFPTDALFSEESYTLDTFFKGITNHGAAL